MSAKQDGKRLLVCCVFLFLAGLVTTSTVKGQGSVLSRVQTIDDPELGELIRVALENLPETMDPVNYTPHSEEYNAAKTARLKTVRLVTEAYVHIKLLDAQISQAEAKLASSNLPGALASELILATADLESQLATKLAELREAMHIIPRHALGRKPVRDLNGWLRLDVIGDSVLAFTCAKPFVEDERQNRHVFVKLMAAKEVTSYAVSFATDRGHHPVRVDILRRPSGAKFAEELQKELIRAIKRLKLELDAEVHLTESSRSDNVQHEYYYALRGKLGSSFERKQQQVVSSGGHAQVVDTEFHVRRPMDSEKFENNVRTWLVGSPERLPLKFFIKYDEQSKDLASQAEGAVRDIAKKLGVDKLVQVTQKELNPEDPYGPGT